MIVIAISSTNCFPVIGADGFHGLCRAAAIGLGPEIWQKPPSVWVPGPDGAGAARGAFRRALLNERVLAKKKKKEKNPPGLLPKNTTQRLFCFAWSSAVLGSPACAPRAVLPAQSPWELGSPLWPALALGCSVPGGLGKPTETPGQGSGWLLPQKSPFPWVVFPVSPRRCSRRGG